MPDTKIAIDYIYKILDYLTRDMFNFNFSEKVWDLVSAPYSEFNNWHTSRTYVRLLFWHRHDIGYMYVDTYTHFFTIIFESFQFFLVLIILYFLKTFILKIIFIGAWCWLENFTSNFFWRTEEIVWLTEIFDTEFVFRC